MSITLIIIAATVVVSFVAWNNGNIYYGFMMNPYEIFRQHQYWRLLTSGFIHSGYVHLGFNMFTFFFFGRVVEIIFGQVLGEMGMIAFILFYLSAIVVSDIPTALKYRKFPGYNSLGASGAVSAMVFASIIYLPLNDICLFAVLCLPGFILGTLYIIYSYTQSKQLSDNINHQAHLYGAVYGVVIAIVVYPPSAANFLQDIHSYLSGLF
jgi:membrane associated rhomboid family serine protease